MPTIEKPSGPKVSLVVPTLQAGTLLPTLIASIRAQSQPPEEILVVDSSSEDDSARIAREAGCRVSVIPRRSFNHGGTRNEAARRAKGNLIVFLTQDVVPADCDFLANLVKPLTEGSAAAYARQIPHVHAPPLENFLRSFNYPPEPARRTIRDVETLGIRAYFFSNAASAVLREQFEEVGGFPENVILNEDMMLCAKLLRAGFTVAYAADARVHHSHRYNILQQSKRYFDIGASIPQSNGLLDHARAHGEGRRFLIGQLRYLVTTRDWFRIPHCLFEAAAKATAFYLGKRERILPNTIKAKLSLQPAFWQRKRTPSTPPR